uniref:Uncharacterized protein n=1 Tax=Arundo donax TaxID=35708 RepID=A0A0A9FPA7_ARUDO
MLLVYVAVNVFAISDIFDFVYSSVGWFCYPKQ